MKKIILLSAFLFMYVAGIAQTKMISHRSHSGKNNTFTAAAKGNMGLRYVDVEDRKKENTTKKLKVDSVHTSKKNNGRVVKTEKSNAKAEKLNKPVVTRQEKTNIEIKKTK